MRTWANAVATTNLSTSGIPSSSNTDDVVLHAVDKPRLLLTENGVDNGVWIVADGVWSRDADSAAPATLSGTSVFITEGTKYGGSAWVCTAPPPITLGTTILGFRRIPDRRDDWQHADLESPTELTDADQTVNVRSTTHNGHFTAHQSLLTDTRNITLGTTNAQSGSVLAITRADTSSNGLIIKVGSTEIHRISVQGTARFVYDGTTWKRDRLLDVLGPPRLNVKHFGAKVDNSTNDYGAVKAALTAGAAASATVEAPEGTARVTLTYAGGYTADNIQPGGNVRLHGHGDMGRSVIRWKPDAPEDTTLIGLGFPASAKVDIADIELLGPAASLFHNVGIFHLGGSNATVRLYRVRMADWAEPVKMDDNGRTATGGIEIISSILDARDTGADAQVGSAVYMNAGYDPQTCFFRATFSDFYCRRNNGQVHAAYISEGVDLVSMSNRYLEGGGYGIHHFGSIGYIVPRRSTSIGDYFAPGCVSSAMVTPPGCWAQVIAPSIQSCGLAVRGPMQIVAGRWWGGPGGPALLEFNANQVLHVSGGVIARGGGGNQVQRHVNSTTALWTLHGTTIEGATQSDDGMLLEGGYTRLVDVHIRPLAGDDQAIQTATTNSTVARTYAADNAGLKLLFDGTGAGGHAARKVTLKLLRAVGAYTVGSTCTFVGQDANGVEQTEVFTLTADDGNGTGAVFDAVNSLYVFTTTNRYLAPRSLAIQAQATTAGNWRLGFLEENHLSHARVKGEARLFLRGAHIEENDGANTGFLFLENSVGYLVDNYWRNGVLPVRGEGDDFILHGHGNHFQEHPSTPNTPIWGQRIGVGPYADASGAHRGDIRAGFGLFGSPSTPYNVEAALPTVYLSTNHDTFTLDGKGTIEKFVYVGNDMSAAQLFSGTRIVIVPAVGSALKTRVAASAKSRIARHTTTEVRTPLVPIRFVNIDGEWYEEGFPDRQVAVPVTTRGSSVTPLIAIAIPDACSRIVRAYVRARKVADGNSASYVRTVGIKRHGSGVATVVGTVVDGGTFEDVAGWDCTIGVDGGNNAVVNVTGANMTRIVWSGHAELT